MTSVFSTALRRCAREPTAAFTLSTTQTRCTFSTVFRAPTWRASRAPGTALQHWQPTAAVVTSRRCGSGVSRRARAQRGRGRGRGGSITMRGTSTKAAAATTAVRETANTSKEDAEEEDDVIAATSSTPRRTRRATQKRTASTAAEAEEEDGDATDALRADMVVEDEDVTVETPTEDPAAVVRAEVDENDEGVAPYIRATRAAAEEEEETRIDGVDEAEAVAATSYEDDSQTTGARRHALIDAEEGEGDEDDNAAAAAAIASSAAVEKSEVPFDTSAADDEMANKFLSVAFPDYAVEYTAAGPKVNAVPVSEVRIDSAVVAAWRCPGCDQTWRCGVFVRCILKNSCPHCTAAHSTTMATARPDLLQLWDYNRNNPFVKPTEIAVDSREMVHWTCPTCGESYTARVRDRVTDKARCPSCALAHATATTATTAESGALLQEWHPLKNGDLRLDQLAPLDRKTKVWWLCGSCGHEWEASLGARLARKRSKGKVCPVCQGRGTMGTL